MKYIRPIIVAVFTAAALVAFFFDWSVLPFAAAALVAATFQIGDALIGAAAVKGNADVMKNETLLQAQSYIAYLENELKKGMEQDADLA